MKTIIVMTLALLLATSYAALAAADDPEQNTPVATTGQSYTIQEIIGKLKTEIAKGTSVYSTNELQTLKWRLDNEERFYEAMTSNS
jgi:hypothetical protein